MHFFFNFQVVTPPHVRGLVSSLGRAVAAVHYSLFSSLSLNIADLLLVHRFSVRLFFCRTCALSVSCHSLLSSLRQIFGYAVRPPAASARYWPGPFGGQSLNHMLNPVRRRSSMSACGGGSFLI